MKIFLVICGDDAWFVSKKDIEDAITWAHKYHPDYELIRQIKNIHL